MITEPVNETISGIYKIVNKTNNKYYVGSSNNIHKRWRYHKESLNKQSHHSKHLQRSWHKYSSSNFELVIIQRNIPNETLLLEEQKYLDIAKQEKEKCYNSSFIAGSIEMNETTRKKISESHKGKHLSDITKEKLRRCNLGKKVSEETKKKLSNYFKGRFVGSKNPMYGKHLSDELKKRLSENSTKPQLGIPHSKEVKQKISETKKSQNLTGHRCATLDKKIYQFQHISTNEIFEGIQFDFYTKYKLPKGNLANVIKGKRKSVGGWELVY